MPRQKFCFIILYNSPPPATQSLDSLTISFCTSGLATTMELSLSRISSPCTRFSWIGSRNCGAMCLDHPAAANDTVRKCELWEVFKNSIVKNDHIINIPNSPEGARAKHFNNSSMSLVFNPETAPEQCQTSAKSRSEM